MATPRNEKPLADLLFEMGEVRADRVTNPRTRRRIVLMCIAFGAWGVLSGFAVFLKVQEESETRSATLVTFLIALLIASVVAFISERISELIRESQEIQEHSSHHSKHSSKGFMSRVLAAIFMLALFELFVTAWHSLAESGFHGELQHLINSAVLPATENKSAGLDLTLMVLLWVTMGVVIGGVLSWLVFRMTGKLALRARWGMVAGIVAGAVAAPLLVSLYVLVVRTVYGVVFFARKNDAWLNTIAALREQHKNSLITVALLLVELSGHTWRIPYAGPWLLLAVLVALIFAARRWRWLCYPLGLLGVGLVMGFSAPLFADTGARFWQIPGLAALVWLFPGAILGALVPRLRNPSEHLGAWGVLAFIAASVLMLVRFLTLAEKSIWYAVAAVIISGAVLLRSRRVQDYWPLMALVVAMLITGVNMLAHATFFNIFEGVYAANSLPPWVDRTLEREVQPGLRRLLGEMMGQQEYVRLQEALEATNSAKLEQKPKAIEELMGQLDEVELGVVDRRWRGEHWQSGLVGFSFRTTVEADDADLAQGIENLWHSDHKDQLNSIESLRSKAQQRLATLEPTASTIGSLPSSCRFYLDRRCSLMIVESDLAELESDLRALFEQHTISEHLRSEIKDYLTRMQMHDTGEQLQQLEALREDMAERLKAAEDKLEWRAEHVELHLEMSLTGSLGFWVTVAFLAGWALLRRQPVITEERGERPRCFWAMSGWREFHDEVHGRQPACDEEFFQRLAFEILAGVLPQSRLPSLWSRCSRLKVVEVATLSAREVADKLDLPVVHLTTASMPRFELVTANAKKLLELTSDSAATASVQTQLSSQGTPQAQILELRRLFRLPAGFAAGSFLQSVGQIEGAHFPGCYRAFLKPSG